MASDDTALSFRPAGYEEVLIRSMLAVCSLANDQLDAESYTLQAMAKQSELARNAEEGDSPFDQSIHQPIALFPTFAGYFEKRLIETTMTRYALTKSSARYSRNLAPSVMTSKESAMAPTASRIMAFCT